METAGLYYYRARHYSPAWGRFVQVDPIGYGGGSNLYGYVGNNPLNSVDPTGLSSDKPSALAFLPSLPGLTATGEAIATAESTAAVTLFAPAAIAAFALVASTTSTADRTSDEVQYVVRAGAGAASSFEAGTALTQNGYGFSVQTAPNVSVDELARGGYFPNKQISVTTLQELQAIPGVTVNAPTPGRGDYHGTVNVPNPPPPGLFDAIAGTFTQRTNPFPVPR